MPQQPHVRRTRDSQGFTLIELLVVILIIGVLAAIAIPSFLAERSKADDAGAKELARTAETVAETIATGQDGTYGGLSVARIVATEPTVNATAGVGTAYLSALGAAPTTTPGGAGNDSTNSYEVSVVAVPTGDVFHIIRNSDGSVVRTCVPANDANRGGCPTGSTVAAGSW